MMLSFNRKGVFYLKKNHIISFNTYAIVSMALFAALSIVFGKYFAFNITSAIRISLENIPIIIAAVAYGPIAGAIVGATADLIGCLLVGYDINPIITLGAASIGLISGICYIAIKKITNKTILHSIVSVIPAHIIGSVIIKTTGLYIYYKLPLWFTLSTRALTYAIIAAAEIIILQGIFKSKILQKISKRH